MSRKTEKYKDYLEIEKEAVISVDKIWMTNTGQYKEGYLGKYLVPSLWRSDEEFRKDIFENVNNMLDIGKLVEKIPEEE